MVELPVEFGNFNFETSSCGEHFDATGIYVQELKQKAKNEGYTYGWIPLSFDYDIPEITDVDYRNQCPIIYEEISRTSDNRISCVTYYLLPERYAPKGELAVMPAIMVFVDGNFKAADEKNLIAFAKAVSYMRFALRDERRENVKYFWEKLYNFNIISHNVVPIFPEDVERANVWAKETFPDNLEYATQGKVGEFAFDAWAKERSLPLTNIDLVTRNTPDHFDFLYEIPFHGQELRIDIKTFLEISENKKRKHWHIKESCIKGSYSKDVFVFIVLEENMQYATIVGMLFANDISRIGEYIGSNDNSWGYYRVYEKDLMNPNYIRALFDNHSRFIKSMEYETSPAKVLEETIKDYPIDPVIAYDLGYPDPYTYRRGGLHNLCCFATKKGIVPIQKVHFNDWRDTHWMTQC